MFFKPYRSADIDTQRLVKYQGLSWYLVELDDLAWELIGGTRYRAYPLGWGSHPGVSLSEFPKEVRVALQKTLRSTSNPPVIH